MRSLVTGGSTVNSFGAGDGGQEGGGAEVRGSWVSRARAVALTHWWHVCVWSRLTGFALDVANFSSMGGIWCISTC